MDDLRAKGEAFLADNAEAVKAGPVGQGDSLATLIYTSGTTGKPKGVEPTHSNWTYEGAFVESINVISINDVHFLRLPLAHSFGKVLLALQLQVGFVTAVDGRVPNIVDNLGVVKPTIMAAVPASSRRSTPVWRRPRCPRWRQGQDLHLGVQGGQRGHREGTGGREGRRHAGRRRASPTSWSSRRSASASVATCAT